MRRDHFGTGVVVERVGYGHTVERIDTRNTAPRRVVGVVKGGDKPPPVLIRNGRNEVAARFIGNPTRERPAVITGNEIRTVGMGVGKDVCTAYHGRKTAKIVIGVADSVIRTFGLISYLPS